MAKSKCLHSNCDDDGKCFKCGENALVINPKSMLKRIESERKQSLKDCWQYHADLMKESNKDLKKADLLDFLYDIELNDWEDVGFFVGYLRGLDDAEKIIKGEEI